MSTVFGTDGADILRGTDQGDKIYGYGGSDTLYGYDGNDTLDGGAGADVLDGGGWFDLVTYASYRTPVRVDLRTGLASFAGRPSETDHLVKIEAIDGGSAGDTIIGDGTTNRLRGKMGSDTLVGNGASDRLFGGAGHDSLDGGAGHDDLEGGAGNDTLRGGADDDDLDVGQSYRFVGDSIEHVDTGSDVYDGGEGDDTLIVSAGTLYNPANPTPFFGVTAAHINLNLGTLRLNDDPSLSTVISIENVWTGSGDDAINGSAAANYLQVGDGANVVYTGGGDDTIIGGWFTYSGIGGDTLNGGAGDDVIRGEGAQYLVDFVQAGIGTDHLAGGTGDDTIWGGAGHSVMSGGTGKDLFVVRAEPGFDQDAGEFVLPDARVVDFEVGDRLRIEKEFRDDTPYRFVGAVAPEDLDYDQVGFYRDGDDTVLVAHLVPSAGSDEYMEITLVGYHGSFTAANYESSILV